MCTYVGVCVFLTWSTLWGFVHTGSPFQAQGINILLNEVLRNLNFILGLNGIPNVDAFNHGRIVFLHWIPLFPAQVSMSVQLSSWCEITKPLVYIFSFKFHLKLGISKRSITFFFRVNSFPYLESTAVTGKIVKYRVRGCEEKCAINKY